jgi:hypothetical protein
MGEFRIVQLQTLTLFLARENGSFEDQASSEHEAETALVLTLCLRRKFVFSLAASPLQKVLRGSLL